MGAVASRKTRHMYGPFGAIRHLEIAQLGTYQTLVSRLDS